jgi:hypothetical protein
MADNYRLAGTQMCAYRQELIGPGVERVLVPPAAVAVPGEIDRDYPADGS